MTDSSEIQVFLSVEFQKRVRTLAKRYRSIKADLQPIIEQLQAGHTIGDQIAGTGSTVFKVRIKNTDIKRGKSAGYRLIYQRRESTYVLLVLIYSKSDHDDVTGEEIRAAIAEFEQSEDSKL
ncbi:MAG TPA: type II toxin-antitoxin system RelE/ParE family toxin [Nodosilinea sp.]|nr:type II toxin-antitoxin system RelE/ParE family toxin [Nodosilinea sp.]